MSIGRTIARCLGVVLLAAMLAGGTFGANALTDNADPRLDKKVTIAVVHTKLEDVVKQLSEQSGVEIKAGTGARDWKVRERKVTIEAKDVTLRILLDEVSKLLGFYISKSGKEGEWAYTYWQDLKARQLESEMLSAAREQVAQRSVAMRQGALDSALEALKLSPEEALKEKDKDPWTAYLGGTKAGRGYAQMLDYMANNFPVERDLMLRGKKTTISLENLPPNLQQAAKDVTMGGYMAFAGTSGQMNQEAKDMFASLTPSQLTIMPMTAFGGDQDMAAAGFGGMVVINARLPEELGGKMGPEMDSMFGGIPMGMFPLARSDSLMGNLSGKMLLAVEEGMKAEEIGKFIQEQMSSPDLFADTLARESPTEKELPTDPEFMREVELDELPKVDITKGLSNLPESIGKEVIAVSKAIEKPVLLESFVGSMPMGMFLKSGKQPLYRILVGMEKAGYVWTLGDSTLRLRPDDWALQRSYEIPESTIARYRDILQKNGEFSLDDLGDLATELTDDQITNTMMEMPEFRFQMLSMQSGFGEGSREILRLYGSLSDQQKGALNADAGLGFAQLSGPQWDRLSAIISDELGGIYIMDGGIRLTKPEAGANGSIYTFSFTILAAQEAQPRTFSKSVTILGRAMLEQMQKSVEDAKEKAETDKDARDAKNGTDGPPKSLDE